MRTIFSKILVLTLTLTLVMSFSVTSFAAEYEADNTTTSTVLSENSTVSPAYLGSNIGSNSEAFKASASNISVDVKITAAEPKGIFLKASVVGDAGTSYLVVVDYPDGKTHATIGVCYPDNGYIQVADYNYIYAGTYTFRFIAQDEFAATNNYVGFIGLIYENL